MSLEQIRIVLVEPSHPGNVGAVARAMKTMGLTSLVMVNPKKFPHIEATNRAAGADDVLDNATVVTDINDAIGDCQFVYGTSVRDREVAWPTVNPKVMAEQITAKIDQESDVKAPPVAILFGRENSGLSNEELDLCHAQIRIDSNIEYSSLNLASAVQIMAYEIRMAHLSKTEEVTQDVVDLNDVSAKQKRQLPATMAEQTGHLNHLQETLLQLDFVKSNPPTKLMRKLTRLYNRADLSVEEIQILRGILTAMQTKLNTPDQ